MATVDCDLVVAGAGDERDEVGDLRFVRRIRIGRTRLFQLCTLQR